MGMNKFNSLRSKMTFRQINSGTPAKVFPLLCPVKEADWIDGWEYVMIYSQSGVAEKGCVFTTPGPGNKITTWYITEHDAENFRIEFVRMAPGEMVVKIVIQLTDNKDGTTVSDISYEYTALSEEANSRISNELDTVFRNSMLYWEKAMNHYLQTGTKLLKS